MVNRPYMNFPSFWPKFTQKDKLGDWFEMYASAMELNVWLNVQLQSLNYDDSKGEWTVKLDRPKDGKTESSKSNIKPQFQ